MVVEGNSIRYKGMPKTRVLIVEDESLVAVDIQSKLEDLGYSVAAIASSGERLFGRHAQSIPI